MREKKKKDILTEKEDLLKEIPNTPKKILYEIYFKSNIKDMSTFSQMFEGYISFKNIGDQVIIGTFDSYEQVQHIKSKYQKVFVTIEDIQVEALQVE